MTTPLHLLVRPFINARRRPLSVRWVSSQIGVAPSGLSLYLEVGKGVGRPKIEEAMAILNVTITENDLPIPEPQSVSVLEDSPETDPLIRRICETPTQTLSVFSESGAYVAWCAIFNQQSALIIIGNQLPTAVTDSPIGDASTLNSHSVTIEQKDVLRWRTGAIHWIHVRDLVIQDTPNSQFKRRPWRHCDPQRFPDMVPEARLLAELGFNQITPLEALETLRQSLAAPA